MAWPGIERLTSWAAGRKGLFLGVVNVAVDELASCFPGGRLAIKLAGEVVKHGTARLLDPAALVDDVKPSGQPLQANQLAELDQWLDRLTRVYGGLLDQLERATGAAAPTGDVTAVVERLLRDNAELARSFAASRTEVRAITLSLSRIEERLDEQVHVQNRLAISLEEYKNLLVDLPGFTDYLQLPEEERRAVLVSNAAFRAGNRDEGVAALLGLLRRQGVGSETVCHQLGMVYLGGGQVGEARRLLEKAGTGGRERSALTRTLVGVTAAGAAGPVGWRSLPRGYVVERRYRIEAEVGRGGMASVYRAIGVDLVNRGQQVAIKVPAPMLMDESATRDRFLQEIQVSQRLSAGNHPGIVRTLNYVVFPDPDTERERYGLVMEYLDGMSLARWLALRKMRSQPLTPREILTIMKAVCAALAFAHEQQPPVLHRDLKPQNIMCGATGGSIKLMDFGIARVLDDQRGRLTGDGLVGTPVYMPPEMCEATGTLDARTDVYLAGNLLLELMTFTPTGDPESRSDCPAEWGDLVGDAMNRLRSRRPATVREFFDRLLAGFRSTPATTPPPLARPLVVGTDGRTDHRSLAEAVRAAPPGCRLQVQPGVYRESLLLDRPVEIVGQGPPEQVIVESVDTACLVLAADAIVIRGLTLRSRMQAAADPVHTVVVRRGNALLDDCTITAEVPHKGSACVLISGTTTRPTLRSCRIQDGLRNGVVCSGGSQAVIEDCDIGGHVVAAITVENGADPVVRRSRLHGSKQSGGVVIWRQGKGRFETCQVFANASDGFRIRDDSAPTLIDCRIHDNRAGGVYVWDGGRPVVERCELFHNALAGLAIRERGAPTVRNCRIHGNGGPAVYAATAGGRVENCDLRGNSQGAWDLRAGCDVQRSDNQE